MGQQKVPEPKAIFPKTYQTVVGKKDLAAAVDLVNRYREEAYKATQDLALMSGSPADIGLRNASTRYGSAADYLASLPKGDVYSQRLTGISNPYEAATAAAQSNLDINKQLLDKAQEAARTYTPPTFETIEPSWQEGDVTKKGKNRKAGERLSDIA